MPANLPNNPNAQPIEGPGPTGQEGYPLAVVGAPGGQPIIVTTTGGPSAIPSDAIANPAVVIPEVMNFGLDFNGTNWDRVRATSSGFAPLASGSRTGTQNIVIQNLGWLGLNVFINVTVLNSPNLTVHIQVQDPATGTYIDIPAPFVITSTGENVFLVAPGQSITGSANVKQVPSFYAPRGVQIQIVPSDGAANTYSVGYYLVK